MSLWSLPVETHAEICKYLEYEDTLTYSNVLDIPIIKLLAITKNIHSANVYPLQEAPRIKLADLNINISKVSKSILIPIDTPDDFLLLQKFSNLKQANFILPHNKYESVTEFEWYLRAFFDALLKRKTELRFKELKFRLLYSSDFNPYLGIVMDKGFIELINSKHFVGFNSEDDDHMMDLDFLVDIIKAWINEIPIFYNVSSGNFLYLYESRSIDDYINVGIIPTDICHYRNSNKEEVLLILEDDLNHAKDNHEDRHAYIKNATLDDYLVVLTEYRDPDLERSDGPYLSKLFQLAYEEDHTFLDEDMPSTKKIETIFEKRLIKPLAYIVELLDLYTLVHKTDYKLKMSFARYTLDELLQMIDESSGIAEERPLWVIIETLEVYDPPNSEGMPNYMYYRVFEKEKKENSHYITNLSDEDTVEWNVSDDEDMNGDE